MSGLAPLSYGTIMDWSRLTGHVPTAAEVDALFQIDVVMSHPDAGEEKSSNG